MSLDRTRDAWERLGESDPLWAVLSTPGTRDRAWEVASFMDTGRSQVEGVLAQLRPLGVDFGHRVLDFGCGVGRLTQALTEHVDEAVGVDIAESMIREAESLNQLGDRARFVHSGGDRLPFDDDSFDSALSLIVLQHIPPTYSLRALLELHRVVRPGGILAFQIPSHAMIPRALTAETCQAAITVVEAPRVLECATPATVTVRVTNVGSGAWPTGQQVRLANHWWSAGDMLVRDDGRVDLPFSLRPGESVDMELRVTSPETPGEYELELDMVQEFVAWWADLGSGTARLAVTVGAGEDPAQLVADNSGGPAAQPATPEVAMERAPEAAITDSDRDVDAEATGIRDSAIEMHPIHVNFIRSMFEMLGSTVLAANEDTLAGPGWASYTYVIQVG